MNVIISIENSFYPKSFTKVLGKEIIFYLLDNLSFNLYNDKIFIFYFNDHIVLNNIKKQYSSIFFIKINLQTNNLCETLNIGLDIIINNYNPTNKLLLLDASTFFMIDIISKYRNFDSNYNLIFLTKNYDFELKTNHIYKSNSSNNIKDITDFEIEKNKINNNKGFIFNNIHKFIYYLKNFLLNNNNNNNNNENNENNENLNIISIINIMFENNELFKSIELDEDYVFVLQTDKEINDFITNYNI